MSIKSIPPPTTCMNWCCDIDECIIVNRGAKFVFSTDGAHTKPQSGFKGQLLNMSGFFQVRNLATPPRKRRLYMRTVRGRSLLPPCS